MAQSQEMLLEHIFLQTVCVVFNSYLQTNSTNVAGTFPSSGGQYGITSINSNGWTQGGYGPMSESVMVAWTWKAGGNKNTFNIDDVGYASAAAAGLTAAVSLLQGRLLEPNKDSAS